MKSNSSGLKLLLLPLILVAITSSISAQQIRYTSGDLNGDFSVDINDIMLFVEHWLDPSGCSGLGCADFDGDNGVDFNDFAVLANKWYKRFDGLIINEFMASNVHTLKDGDGKSSDWIEIYNTSDATINLLGWHLTDDPDILDKWPFPDETIAGGGYFLVFASGEDVNDYVDAGGYYHTNFNLSKNGEYLALVRPDGVVMHEFDDFPAQDTDISYGLDANAINLVSRGANASLLIPSDGSLGNNWIRNDFIPDTNYWSSVHTGVGFTSASTTEVAGQLLVNLRRQDLHFGLPLTNWSNKGTLGGSVANTNNPLGISFFNYVPAVVFTGSSTSYLQSSGFTAQASFTGNSDWSIEAWAYNQSIASQEAMVEWSRDSSFDGKCGHLEYGTSGSSGAIYHGGSTDMGFDGGVPAQTNGII